LLFLRLLVSLLHGGSPPYGNPIIRSGEVRRHSKINSAQGISSFNGTWCQPLLDSARLIGIARHRGGVVGLTRGTTRRRSCRRPLPLQQPRPADPPTPSANSGTFAEVERNLILRALEANEWNKTVLLKR